MLTEKERAFMEENDIEKETAESYCDACKGSTRCCPEQYYGGTCDGFNEEVETTVKEGMAE